MPEKNDEIKEQAVNIIIAQAKNIEDGNHFDNDISFQVVPVRITGTEYTCIPTLVIRSKNIDEIFAGICMQQLVLFPCKIIHIPIIISSTINMYRYPANSNTSKNLKQEEAKQITTADTCIFNERHTQYQGA